MMYSLIVKKYSLTVKKYSLIERACVPFTEDNLPTVELVALVQGNTEKANVLLKLHSTWPSNKKLYFLACVLINFYLLIAHSKIIQHAIEASMKPYTKQNNLRSKCLTTLTVERK